MPDLARIARSLVAAVLLGAIRLYQTLLSPLLPSSCRFSPSCSDYTAQAIRRFGPLRGTWLGTKRICRCHPWSEGGHDPVPLKKDTLEINAGAPTFHG